MKRLTVFLLVFAAVWGGEMLCRAQGAELKPPAKRKFQYTGKIVTSFEKEKDETMVLIQLMRIQEGEDPNFDYDLNTRPDQREGAPEHLEFSMYFTHPGQTLTTPPKFVTLGFLYFVLEPHRYESRLLTAKIDGVKVDLGKMELKRQRSVIVPRAYKPYTWVALEMTIPYQQFLSLANAKRVKMKLGEVDFDLNKDHLEAIRDLASRTAP